MRKLDKQLLVQIIREEWNKKKDNFLNESGNALEKKKAAHHRDDAKVHPEKDKKDKGVSLKGDAIDLVSPGLTVTDPDGIESTIVGTGDGSIKLQQFVPGPTGEPVKRTKVVDPSGYKVK